ncbi:MAG: sigma-70 family RNA polymerase sigma factor [Clostridiales Family XIII bacterium]|jgi:RNA polymerase sigma-70 factor (ECF subfamily)|nr:sigma-70 family RNA polymerase sigma factor [Clostridiales Family XIII bacterium]
MNDFETIYKTYHAEIGRFIYTIARCDVGIAEDISQNTWQNVFQYLNRLNENSALRGWLYTIARNEAKRYFSQHGVRMYTEVFAQNPESEPEIVDDNESRFPEALANRDLLIKLLNQLTKEEQQIILLHDYYDIGLNEIAETDGSNYNTVKSTYRRTMAKLRRAAEELPQIL